MGTLGKRALFETLRSIDSATFTGSYQAVGTILANPSVWFYLYNDSGVIVTVSDDGVNDKFIVPSKAGVIIDVGSDSQSTSGNGRLYIGQGTQIWVKASASTGLFYLSTMYQGG